jgi:tetratricopeptide (TPR) repeat protein
MTDRVADRKSAAGREALEDERDFLLRSLDDLDNELIAGNIDPDTYRVLHDDYTARASAVIRSLADGVDRHSPDAPRVPPAMRILTVGGIVVFAVLAAVLLAHAIGERRPGQTITGNAQAGGVTTTVSPATAVAAAKAAALAQPKSYAARINYARALSSIDPTDAIKEYIAAAKLDPTQPEPLAYSGWLTALVARQAADAPTKTALLTAAERNLDQAISVDPTYAPSYVFKGLLLAQIENKQCAGAQMFQEYMVTASANDPMRPQVLSALEQAVKAGKCPALPSTPTTKP